MERTGALRPFEQRVTTAGAPLNDGYGVGIHDKLQSLSGRQACAWTMPDINRRGGRLKRSYKVKPTGMAALRHSVPIAGPVCAALDRYGERLWAGERTG